MLMVTEPVMVPFRLAQVTAELLAATVLAAAPAVPAMPRLATDVGTAKAIAVATAAVKRRM